MDKLKNMMSSNKSKDTTDESSPTTGDLANKNLVAGEGSHFGSSRATNDTVDPLTSSSAGTGTHQGINAPPPSRMPGAFDDGDAGTTASISSGVPGKSQSANPVSQDFASNTGNTALPHHPAAASGSAGMAGSGLTGTGNTAGPHSSSLENKLDPRVDSDLDGRSGLSGAGQPGAAGTGLTGTSNTAAGPHSSSLENKLDPRVDSDLDGRSGLTGGQTGTVGSGLDSGRSFPLSGGSSNTAPGTGTGTGTSGGYTAPGQIGKYPAGVPPPGSSTTAGPHSSNLENKLDPRVDSDLDGRNGLGNTGVGAAGTGYSSGTAPVASSGNTGQLGTGTGTGLGTTAGQGSGLTHAGHSHEFRGDPCGPEEAVAGAPHFTSGPHATDTANRLDPHVSSGIGAPSSTTGSGLGTSHTTADRGLASSNTGAGTGLESSSGPGTSADPLGSSTSGTTHQHHTGRDAAALGAGAGVGAAGLGAHEAGLDPKQSSSTGPAPNTAGPHKSDILNKLDPRVDSDLSKQKSGTTSASDPLASSSTSTSQHHTGRDAALAGGVGAAGVGAYEAEKHHNQKDDPIGTTDSSVLGSSNTAAAPHHSHHHGHHDRQEQATEHHPGRDAALVGGAGAAGAGIYEADKHHHQQPQDPSVLGSTSTSNAPHHSHHHGHHDRQEHAKEHHPGRDAALVGGAGTAAGYEAERHQGHPTQSSTIPSTTAGTTLSSRDPAISTQDPAVGTGHHYGRDAGLVGAGGVAAYEGEKHLGHHEPTGQTPAGAQSTGPGLTGNTAVGGTQSGLTDRVQKDHSHQHHPERDAAIAAGAGGAAYEADKHHDKDAKHHDSGKKSGGILGIFHRDKGDKEARAEEKAERKAEHREAAALGTGGAAAAAAGGTAYEADKHAHRPIHGHGQGDEEMAGGVGAVGLTSDPRDAPLDQKLGVPSQTEPQDQKLGVPSQVGAGDSAISSGSGVGGMSQAGAQDLAISSGTGVAGVGGAGNTTHDAYGENDPNRVNRLHKDPPAGRGL